MYLLLIFRQCLLRCSKIFPGTRPNDRRGTGAERGQRARGGQTLPAGDTKILCDLS